MLIKFTVRLMNALAFNILFCYFMLTYVNKLTFYCEVLTHFIMTARSWVITFIVIMKRRRRRKIPI